MGYQHKQLMVMVPYSFVTASSMSSVCCKLYSSDVFHCLAILSFIQHSARCYSSSLLLLLLQRLLSPFRHPMSSMRSEEPLSRAGSRGTKFIATRGCQCALAWPKVTFTLGITCWWNYLAMTTKIWSMVHGRRGNRHICPFPNSGRYGSKMAGVFRYRELQDFSFEEQTMDAVRRIPRRSWRYSRD